MHTSICLIILIIICVATSDFSSSFNNSNSVVSSYHLHSDFKKLRYSVQNSFLIEVLASCYSLFFFSIPLLHISK